MAIEGTLDANTLESAELTLTGNAYRFATADINDMSLSVYWMPADTVENKWYLIQSAPKDDNGDVPLIMEAGDKLKIVGKVIGDGDEAHADYFLGDLNI